ncbi:NADPH-glutathione reductase [Litorimonas taeanensis]|uniref:Glutathione reductase n=1 Tax=Litorimonas taeanensis TaxID=568099 RepID=A0A420WKG2_9PROT|nr:glutathione-disulfide reductase [Litorimonas taeanensis]RKQ71541.1 NADPH-glutathione reductase [Litorimonas taeanensis]
MSDYDFDLFVIGAGSGGVRSGRLAAQLGKKVGVAEESLPGGTCVVRGCVPKKFLVYGADFGGAIKDAQKYGWTVGETRFDWPVLRDSIQKEVARLSGIYSTILEKNGAEVFRERAEFVDEHTVRLATSGKTVTAETILIAVGGRPWAPEIPGIEHAIVSDDAFTLETLPERVLVIGGGYIACEFAGIYAGLGCKTTQVYRGGRLLNGFDAEVRDEAGVVQEQNGVSVKFNLSPTEIKKTSGGYIVTFDDGSKIGTDVVFMATGRKPHTKGLGLENAGVDVDEHGAVKVDKYSKTSQDNIYAVGDVTNRVNLTPVAIREGMAFIETVFKDNATAYDHTQIASAVFTRPPIGVVGVTESEARKMHGDDITVYTTHFRPMKNVLAEKPQKVFMKLITQGKQETVIGIHIVGDDSAEMIQPLGICVKAGLTKADFDATCAVHPTISEEIVTLKPREINKTTVVT